ncbi:sorting nexin lst-4-like [Chelonus insularis]|uniref:sorting nexin lst-4-like n=1 Tax=Chelonus insularis TaxID=460826 RepID=UPI0015895EB2|nr:sorting nexin lst-4-like [Chelonus insularis]
MENKQVRAVYDFSGEPGTAELSINAGEILTVTRDNVGDGWCEGYNHLGQSGLFPAAYVQAIDSSTVTATAPVSQSSGDYWDDDWDDDSEIGQSQPYTPSNNQYQQSQMDEFAASQMGVTNHPNDLISMPTAHTFPIVSERSITNIPKKNNKFSTLIKSGEDSFLMGTKTLIVPEDEKIFVQETEDGHCYWLPHGDVYNCVVTSPKKGSKLKGLKSFIVYQLTPTVLIYHK